MNVTTEIIRRVYDDQEGACFEVRPDQDGLGILELHTPDEKSSAYFGSVRISLDKEIARALGKALMDAADD